MIFPLGRRTALASLEWAERREWIGGPRHARLSVGPQPLKTWEVVFVLLSISKSDIRHFGLISKVMFSCAMATC